MGVRERAILFMAAGQGVAFAVSPWLSRMYSPEDFGNFALFSSCFSFLTIALTLRYEQAILYADSAIEASQLATLSLLLSAALSVFLMITAASLDALGIALPLSLGEIALAVASSLFCTSQRVATTLWIRWRQFRHVATLSLFRSGLVGIMQLLIGSIIVTKWGLTAGHTVAYFILLLMTCAIDKRSRKFVRRFEFQTLLRKAAQYSGFPKYNMTQNLLYVASELIVPILIVDLFGHASAGLYWLAARVTMVPAQVLIESIRGMIYREVSGSLGARRDVRMQLVGWALRLAAPFILGGVLVGACGDAMFGLVFGSRWAESGRIAAILFGFAAVQAACVPYIAALPLIKAGQRTYLGSEAAALSMRIAVFLMCAKAGMFAAVALSGAASACVYLVFLGWVHRTIGEHLEVDSSPVEQGAG